MTTIDYCGYDCYVEKIQYPANKQIALELFAVNSKNNFIRGVHPGEHIIEVTTCIQALMFKPNQTAISGYADIGGLLDELENKGVVKRTGEMFSTDFITLPVVEVLI